MTQTSRRNWLALVVGTPLAAQEAVPPACRAGFEELLWPPEAAVKRPVYRKGSGPPVVILQELSGLSPATFALGERLIKEGFTVYLPLLFGKACEDKAAGSIFGGLCSDADFECHDKNYAGPVVDWLGGLARYVDHEHGNKGIGMIGSCLTGAFPLALLGDVNIVAPVVVQPALPFSRMGISTKATRSGLGISDPQLLMAKRTRVPIYACRFENDKLSPEERMQRLEKEFGARLTARRVKPNPAGCAHTSGHDQAVLTGGYCEDQSADSHKVYLEVVEFLRKQLKPA